MKDSGSNPGRNVSFTWSVVRDKVHLVAMFLNLSTSRPAVNMPYTANRGHRQVEELNYYKEQNNEIKLKVKNTLHIPIGNRK